MNYQDKTKEELIGELAQQKQELDSLKALFNKEINERKYVEFVLGERLKELACHNQISKIFSNPALSIETMCEEIIQVVPEAFQFPKLTRASLCIYDKVYEAPHFEKTKYFINQQIKVKDQIIGQLEVYYTGEELTPPNQIFLPEESMLLWAISSRIGKYLEFNKSDEDLQQNELKYKELVENINDVVYEIDTHGIIQYISPSIERILGFTSLEITGKNFLDFVGENADFLAQRFALLKEKFEISNEYKLHAKTGEERWIRLSTRAIYRDNTLSGAFGTLIDITEKKQLDLELQKSEAMYRSILQASPDTIFISDLEGHVLFTSPMAIKMFGYEASGFPLGISLFSFIDPADHPKAREAIRQMFDGKFAGSTEYIGVKSDGTRFDMDVNGEFIRDSEGNPTSMVFIARDISDRKMAEHKLRMSESLYKSVLDASPDTITITDLTGKIVFLSPKALKMFGYEKTETLIDRSLFDFIDEKSKQKAQTSIMEMFQGHMLGAEEYTAVKADGTHFEIEVNGDFILNENGEPINMLFVTRDISERKLAEEKLRKSEETYRVLVETINDVVYEVTSEGIVNYVSPSIERFLGYKPEELIGQNFFKYMHEDDRHAIIERLTTLNQRNYSFLEYRYYSKDGNICWVRSSTNPMFENGKMIGGRGVLIDITERKKAEEDLRESEEKFRMIFNNVFDGISIFEEDPDPSKRRLIDCNEQYAAMSGRTRDELLKLGNISSITQSIEGSNNEARLHGISEKLAYHGSFKWNRPDGKDNSIEYIAMPITWQGKSHSIGIDRDITEQKQKENELRKLSQAVEQSPVSIVITDLDGNIEYANPKACRSTGYNLDELKGKNPRVLKSGETPNNEYQYLWDSISHGNNWSGIFHNKRKNGELYWESSKITPIIDENGQVTNYLALKEDITERKRIEEELIRSEDRFRQVAAQSQTVIWEVNEQGLYTYVSPIARQVWGYEPEDLIGLKHFYDIHPADGREEFKQAAFEIFRSKGVFKELINPILTKTNSTIWVSTNGEPILDKNKNLIGYRGADNDVTAKRAAEEALKQSEIELNYAQEIANMGSWNLDLKTNHMTWSENYYRMLGLEPFQPDIPHDYFSSLVHPDDKHLFDEKQAEMQSTRQPVSFDMRLIMPGGQIKWVQNNVVPRFIGDKLSALSGVNIDITEKKLAAEKIKQQNERLSAIINAMPDLIFVSDRNGQYLEYFKSNSAELIYPENTLIGSNVKDVFDENTANLHISKINECIDSQQLITYEYSSSNNGQTRYYEARLTPLENDRVLRFIRDFTDQRLKDNEVKKLSLAVTQSPVSIVITDLDANIQYVNPAFETTSGYRFEEVIGKNTNILKSGQTDQSVYRDLWTTIEKGLSWKGEWINKKKNGEFFWEDISITPIHDHSGKTTNYLAIKQDITERKRTEELLIQNEEKYRYMFVNNPEPMWIYDLETLAFLEVNSAAIDHYGYSRDEFLAMTLKDIRPKDDVESLIADVANSPDLYSPASEWRHLKKDGELINVEIISHPIVYNDRKARHVLVNDITKRKMAEAEIRELNANLEIKIQERTSELEVINNNLLKEIDIRKLTEQALARSENSYRTVVENVAEVIFQTDTNGLWVFLNKSWETITGFTVNESIGQLFINYVHPDDRQRNWEFFEPLILRQKDYCRHEIRYLTKDGGFRWIEVYAQLGLDENGQIIGTYGTLQDITERKKAEEELLQLSARLELAVRVGKIGVWDYDAEHNNLYWDDQMFEIYGIGRNDFVNTYEAWYNGLHPDDREKGNLDVQAAIKGEREFDTEFRIVQPNGSVHHIKALAALQLDSNRSRHLIGINWDVTLQRRLAELENELIQLSPKLTGIALPEIDAAINLALSRIGKVLNADRSYIFELSPDHQYMNNSFEWCNDDIEPQIRDLQNVPTEMLPEWMEKLNNLENIIIDSVKDLPESWTAEREILEPQGIKSLIVIPMLVENNLIGFVGLDSVRMQKTYTPTEINILKIWSSMLSSLINNQRNEKLLEQTRQNYETFFNTIDDFLWVLDTDGNIVHTNDTVKNRLNYSTEELLNKSVLMVHPPERRNEAGQIVKEMLVGKAEFCPVPVVTKSGKMIPVETRVKSGFWNGAPVIFGISKDISQVQLSEQKFASAFQSNSAIMAISNFTEGQYIDINNAFLETLNYSREEVIGKTNRDLSIFIDENEREEIIQILNKNIPVRKREVLMRTKNGDIKTGLISADSIFIGETRCLLTVTIDISDRKKAEEELKKARIEAEQANAAKSEFLSRMSHELRTPMNSILGFAQLLEMGDLNPGQKKGVNHIMKSGKHLLDLINEVLDISRIESGRLSLSLEPVQLSSLIPEMTDVIRPQLSARQINIELVDSPDNFLFVKTDRQRLKQVMLNLLNNAIKYNQDGGSIRINVQQQITEERKPEMVRISITDTGIGIPEEFIPKLFTPFERIGADKTTIEGTGLGLSVVKKLMDAMGGNLGVESTPGLGSTFWVELPHVDSQLESAAKSGNLTGNESLVGKKGLILYIEDNLSNIDLVVQILQNQRSDIELLTDTIGRKTVQLAINHKPDLILLDLNLPDMHGSKVLEHLLAEERTKDIPVVIISADAMPQQLNKLLKAGARNYLTKPLDIPEFLKVIDNFLPAVR